MKKKTHIEIIKSAYRRGWGEISPVTRIKPSAKIYSRKGKKVLDFT